MFVILHEMGHYQTNIYVRTFFQWQHLYSNKWSYSYIATMFAKSYMGFVLTKKYTISQRKRIEPTYKKTTAKNGKKTLVIRGKKPFGIELKTSFISILTGFLWTIKSIPFIPHFDSSALQDSADKWLIFPVTIHLSPYILQIASSVLLGKTW